MGSIRDVQCAIGVGEMSKLGRFDKEFIMYGCAYLENDDVHYMISSSEEQIYDFIAASVERGLYPTPIMEIFKSCSVPAGTEEDIALEVKVDLAKKLRAAYPKAFFEALLQFADQPANDGALPMLAEIQDVLEGQFIEEKLQLFEHLVHLAYEGKVLTTEHYKQFKQWLHSERAQMTDDVVVKEIFERTFYGIAYEKADGKLAHFFNGQKENTYGRITKLQKEGLITTPIYQQTRWFDYSDDLKGVRRAFEIHLKEVLDAGYMSLVKKIKSLPAAIDADQFKQVLMQVETHYGAEAAQGFTSYGRRWHVL